MSLDNEWKRVMGNPDNVIVSDSIRDLLSADEVGDEIVHKKHVAFTCTINAGEVALSGMLCNYQISKKDYRISLELPLDDISVLLGITRFDSVILSNSADQATLEIHLGDDDADPEISIDLGSSIAPFSPALVSIVISK